jgi:DeoR/GlpR family transcriptional regulator of sugar metabolism
MLVDERRARILRIAENRGFVSLQELVSQVEASESTIRRDLEHLDGIGQIRRTRGGAAYVGDSLTPFDARVSKALTQKQRIAQAAAELIESDETVLLDGGTTTLEVARHLLGKSLQVVTNSLPIVNLLANHPSIELVLIGGYLYPKTGVALGPLAVQALASVKARRLVMSVGGLTEDGLFNSNALLVETERGMIEAADEVLVVADSSKFGRSALARLGPLDVVDRVVTDSGLSGAWRTILDRAGIATTIVED